MTAKTVCLGIDSSDFKQPGQKSTHLSGLRQALTEPVEAPLPAQEPRKVHAGAFWAPAQEGGGRPA